MNIVRDVFSELRAMFIGDARLALGISIVIIVAAVLVTMLGIDPLIAGGVLLAGSIAALIEAVFHSARAEAL